MDINQVIYLGNQIKEPAFLSSNYDSILMIFGFIILIIGFLLILIYRAESIIGLVIMFIGFVFSMGGVIYYQDNENKYEESINKWKNEIVIPYINSLPKEKGEVIYLKIEPELEVDANVYWWNTYITEVKRTPLTASFKEGKKITTLTNWYDTNMNLTNEDTPYIEYQKLEVNLGHGVDAGYYNLSVNLPEDYKFSDIK